MVALLQYTVLRLALFVGLLLALAFLGADRLVALIGAALGSMMLSYLLLRRPRAKVAQLIADRVERNRLGPRPTSRGTLGLDDDAAAEDAAIDGTPPSA